MPPKQLTFREELGRDYFGGNYDNAPQEVKDIINNILKDQTDIFPEQEGMIRTQIEAILQKVPVTSLYEEKLDLWAKQNNVNLNAPDSKIPDMTIKEGVMDSLNTYLKDPKLFKDFTPTIMDETEVKEPTIRDKKRENYIKIMERSPNWATRPQAYKDSIIQDIDFFLSDPVNLKHFLPQYIKDMEEKTISYTSKIPIMWHDLPEAVQDDYAHLPKDEPLLLSSTEIRNIGNQINKKWNPNTNQFEIKNKAEYNKLLKELKEKVDNNRPISTIRNRVDKLIKIYPNIQDSLYQVIEIQEKKYSDEKKEEILAPLWRILGYEGY